MAGILNKLMDFIGIEDVDDEGYNEDYFNDEQQSMAEDNVVSLGNRGRRKTAAGNNVVSLPTAAPMKMVVYHPVVIEPKGFDECPKLVDNLKSRKPVIVNMEELEIDCAQRILDFMAGAIYALDGTIYKISRGIFVVAPTNYDVIGNDDRTDVDVI